MSLMMFTIVGGIMRWDGNGMAGPTGEIFCANSKASVERFNIKPPIRHEAIEHHHLALEKLRIRGCQGYPEHREACGPRRRFEEWMDHMEGRHCGLFGD